MVVNADFTESKLLGNLYLAGNLPINESEKIMKPNNIEFFTGHGSRSSDFVTVTQAQNYLSELFACAMKKNDFRGVLPIKIASCDINNGQKWAVCFAFRQPVCNNAIFRLLASLGVPGSFHNIITVVIAYRSKMDTLATASDATNLADAMHDLPRPYYRIFQVRHSWYYKFDIDVEAKAGVYLYPSYTCLDRNGSNLLVGETFTRDNFDAVLNVIYNNGLRK